MEKDEDQRVIEAIDKAIAKIVAAIEQLKRNKKEEIQLARSIWMTFSLVWRSLSARSHRVWTTYYLCTEDLTG